MKNTLMPVPATLTTTKSVDAILLVLTTLINEIPTNPCIEVAPETSCEGTTQHIRNEDIEFNAIDEIEYGLYIINITMYWAKFAYIIDADHEISSYYEEKMKQIAKIKWDIIRRKSLSSETESIDTMGTILRNSYFKK